MSTKKKKRRRRHSVLKIRQMVSSLTGRLEYRVCYLNELKLMFLSAKRIGSVATSVQVLLISPTYYIRTPWSKSPS
jgi:hypothetical protein